MNSNNKNIVFTAIMTCIMLFTVELIAYFSYAIQTGDFRFTQFNTRIESILGTKAQEYANFEKSDVSIHPYIGYVNNPEVVSSKDHSGVSISDYGFIDTQSPIHIKNPNEIIIGITGGSVAAWFFIQSRDDLEKALRQSPFFQSKKITFVNTALGGYKQPQQLIALTYLLSLGAKFDIIINLDGYNDLVLPIIENIPKSVNPYYPRNWYIISQNTPARNSNSIAKKAFSIEEKRIYLAKLMESSLLQGNILSRVVWFNYDRFLENSINRLQQTYLNQTILKTSFATSGPQFLLPPNENDTYLLMAKVWAQASNQMHLLSSGNGIKYFHFLQPNQYVPNTKILSKEEMKVAFDSSYPLGLIVKNGYKLMQSEGQLLRRNGVNYHDLTGIFKNTPESIYVDVCCHLNKHGNKILANQIAKTIISSY